MLLRKPLPLWTSVVIFALPAAATPLACRLLRPPNAPPRTLTELTERLSRAEPELYVIPVTPNVPESGVWSSARGPES